MTIKYNTATESPNILIGFVSYIIFNSLQRPRNELNHVFFFFFSTYYQYN